MNNVLVMGSLKPIANLDRDTRRVSMPTSAPEKARRPTANLVKDQPEGKDVGAVV